MSRSQQADEQTLRRVAFATAAIAASQRWTAIECRHRSRCLIQSHSEKTNVAADSMQLCAHRELNRRLEVRAMVASRRLAEPKHQFAIASVVAVDAFAGAPRETAPGMSARSRTPFHPAAAASTNGSTKRHNSAISKSFGESRRTISKLTKRVDREIASFELAAQ